jgi:hypothetical protein
MQRGRAEGSGTHIYKLPIIATDCKNTSKEVTNSSHDLGGHSI